MMINTMEWPLSCADNTQRKRPFATALPPPRAPSVRLSLSRILLDESRADPFEPQ